MDRVKSLFTTRKTYGVVRGTQLKAQGYDEVSEQEPPIMGSMSVSGNGPPIHHMYSTASKRGLLGRRLSTDDAAISSPATRRDRSDSNQTRPRTAPSKGRTYSGFSIKAAPELPISKSQHSANISRLNSRSIIVETRTSTMTTPTMRPSHSEMYDKEAVPQRGRRGSSYIDLFDAVTTVSISSSRRGSNKTVASGRRDYGEDVADRNIADFGSGDINLHSPQFAYIRNFYIKESREIKRARANGSLSSDSGYGRVRNASAATKGEPLAPQAHDDTGTKSTPSLSTLQPQAAPPNPRTIQSARLSTVYSHQALQPEASHTNIYLGNGASPRASVNTNESTSTQPRPPISTRTSSITSTTSRDFHYPTHSDRTRSRSLARSPPPASSVAVNGIPTTVLSRPSPPRKDSVAESHIEDSVAPLYSRRASLASTKSYIPTRGRNEAGDTDHLRLRESSLSKSRKQLLNNIAVSPTRGLVDSPTVPVFSFRHIRNTVPGSSQSVATYTPPPPLPHNNLKQHQTRESSPLTPSMSLATQTITQTAIPPRTSSLPQGSDRDSENYTGPQILYGGGGGDKRERKMIHESNEPIPIDGVLDLTNTVDTDRTITQAPAVIHEHVQPKVHHHTEERITREIHTHDIFHRILPVIDIEILPTKHYVPDPERPGTLIEIPESMVPARNQNWRIAVKDQIAAAEASIHAIAAHKHAAHQKALPVLSSKKSYITKEGVPKTEYVWRHPPVLEPVAYETGETMPVRMSCVSDEDFALQTAVEDHTLYDKSINNAHGASSGKKTGLSHSELLIQKREEQLREAERQVAIMLADMNLNPAPAIAAYV